MDANTANLNQPSSTPAGGYNPGTFGEQSASGMITPQKTAPKKEKTSKNIILVAVLLLVLAGLVFGFGKARSFLSKASGGCQPTNVTEENITPNSVEIVFQTDKICQAEIAYGTSSKEEALLLRIPEALASLNHRIRLAPLLPSTAYYYQIIADGEKTQPIYSFLTGKTTTAEEVAEPTIPVTQPSPAISAGGKAEKYTITDFQAVFGTGNTIFDIDKNGTVNIRDWMLYQKTTP